MTNRKLASIRKIDIIKAIPDAESIECAILGGWPVVVKKGEFKVGDLAVYIEIDSWVPTELAPFLSKDREPSEYEGIKGERLRTVRLRKQLSQGLLLPLSTFDQYFEGAAESLFEEGSDVTSFLGIIKYEPPLSAALAGEAKGLFPSFIPKTDQQRVQNISDEDLSFLQELDYEVTEKLEGSSCTMFIADTELNVCSRNLNLKKSEFNTFWKVAVKFDIENKLSKYPHLALQGELIGPGVQGNIYNLKDHEFRVFDIFNMSTQQYLPSKERLAIRAELGLDHVPVISNNFEFEGYANTREFILDLADGASLLNANVPREGLVFKSLDNGLTTFKAISNRYLEKQK